MQESKEKAAILTTKEELDNLYKNIQTSLSSPKNEDVLVENQAE